MARPARRPGNLPADATSFIGRRRELDQLKKRLAAARLVSLVGPGGVGKTRLALRLASDLQRGFRDGAWLVELADVHDPTPLTNAVLAALDLRDQATTEPSAVLRGYLRDKQMLLVLDNCEHVLEPAAQLVNELLRVAGGMRVIATSREPLAIGGEHVVPVAPLELPASDADAPLSQLRQNEAVMLFSERAVAASGRFELNDANAASVVDLCRRLDGLPLAIELAAVRTRVLPIEQILARLSDRFALLTGGSRAALPRHQTLLTTMEWSHDLLTEDERALLRRLSIFAGRFLIEDVEAVCADGIATGDRTLDLLSSVVDKSLLTVEVERGRAIYRFHETVREFARLKLHATNEPDALAERCANYYLMRCAAAGRGARYKLVEFLEWMEVEIDNVRSVLRRFHEQADVGRGLALVGALAWYWIARATSEGLTWLDTLLALESRPPPTIEAWTLFLRGFIAVLHGEAVTARPILARAVTAARETAQLDALSQSLSMAAIAEGMLGNRASAHQLLDASSEVTANLVDPAATVALLQARTLIGFFEADIETAEAAATDGARLCRETGDLYSLQMMLLNLGLAAFMRGDRRTAQAQFREGLEIARQIDDRVGQLYLLGALGCEAAATSEPRRAAHLLGAAERVRTELDASVNAIVAPLVAQAEKAARGALGPSRFEREVASGLRLRRDAALALALGLPTKPSPSVAAETNGAVLGRREHEVALLVGDGLSNKQIGARLFISERTVDTHVRGILNKLGFSSRTQIAAWIASRPS